MVPHTLNSDPNLKRDTGRFPISVKERGSGAYCEGGSVFRLPGLTKSGVRMGRHQSRVVTRVFSLFQLISGVGHNNNTIIIC